MSPPRKRPARRKAAPPRKAAPRGKAAPARKATARRPTVERKDVEDLLAQLGDRRDSAQSRRIRQRLVEAMSADEGPEHAARGHDQDGGGEVGDDEERWGEPVDDVWAEEAEEEDEEDHEEVDATEDGEDGWYGQGWDPWAARRRTWATPSRPLPVEGGLTTRSRRGAIGETWWSQRFLAAIEALMEGGRSTRGRSYARQGQVMDLSVAAGLVEARVQGSRRTPYRVRLVMPAVPDADWERIVAALAGQAGYAARLLAGDLPHEMEEVFTAEGASLFPSPTARLTTECSCPDWSNPCKHVAAVCYLLAEAFDRDPFGLLAWRGRTRDQLLDRLRALRRAAEPAADQPTGPATGPATRPAAESPGPTFGPGGRSAGRGSGGPAGDPPGEAGVEGLGADVPPLAECHQRFFDAGADLDAVLVRPDPADLPSAVLRHLPRGLLEVGGHDVVDLFEPAYAEMVAAAARRALGGDGDPRRGRTGRGGNGRSGNRRSQAKRR